MKLVAAALLGLTAAPALAQDGAGPSQESAWHNRQQAALAERAAQGWYALPGGVLWRRVAGDGLGARPDEQDTVTLHYAGTLVDGTEFDIETEDLELLTRIRYSYPNVKDLIY